MAEKLTPTFVIKLAVLFALLLVGVFLRPNKLAQPTNAKSTSELQQHTSAEKAPKESDELEYRLVRSENKSDSSL